MINKQSKKDLLFKVREVPHNDSIIVIESNDGTRRKLFKCPYENCQKIFKEKGNLKTHIRVHTGDRPFLCNYKGCSKAFLTMGNLKSHYANHTGEKLFICKYSNCKKRYARLCRLKIHERTHTGEKPFVCPYEECKKSFNEKGNLKTHLRIHTGEKPYKCLEANCGKSFKAQGHLRDHIKRHLNVRPYECRICKSRYSRSSTLKIHYLTHKNDTQSQDNRNDHQSSTCESSYKPSMITNNINNYFTGVNINNNVDNVNNNYIQSINSMLNDNEEQNTHMLIRLLQLSLLNQQVSNNLYTNMYLNTDASILKQIINLYNLSNFLNQGSVVQEFLKDLDK